MKSNRPEWERLVTMARAAAPEASPSSLPPGIAVRVMRELRQSSQEGFDSALTIVRWGLAASLAVVVMAAVFAVASPGGKTPSSAQFILQQQFANLVLNQ